MNTNNVKGLIAVASGIGAFVCSLISASELLNSESCENSSSVKKKGKGCSAVYIRENKGKKKCIFSAAAAVLLAVTGLLYTVLYYEGRNETSEEE